MLENLPRGGSAAVFGSGGAIGAALVQALHESGRFAAVHGFSHAHGFDITREADAAAAAARLAGEQTLRLAVIATGFLHGPQGSPEKRIEDLTPQGLAHAFAVNAIGPALVLKHLLPLLAREGRSIVAALSARVGSIGDNRAGGWYSYRASKAALNQTLRTAAIELARKRPEAVCVSLHPGTVDSKLSAPFAKTGLEVHSPADAARHLLTVVGSLTPAQSGSFLDWRGDPVPW